MTMAHSWNPYEMAKYQNESKTSKIISYETQNPLIKWNRAMLVAIIAINLNKNIAEIIVEIP